MNNVQPHLQLACDIPSYLDADARTFCAAVSETVEESVVNSQAVFCFFLSPVLCFVFLHCLSKSVKIITISL